MYRGIVILSTLLVFACTSVAVKPLDQSLDISHVCIENNPEVLVVDFETVLVEGLDRQGISVAVFSKEQMEQCEYVLTYTARRKWDFKPFLAYAFLRLEKDGIQIAHAEYRHSGGFALNKWASTREKIDPVIDELLGSYEYVPNEARTTADPHADISTDVVTPVNGTSEVEVVKSRDNYAELIKLDELRERGILTQAEFEAEKKKILERN